MTNVGSVSNGPSLRAIPIRFPPVARGLGPLEADTASDIDAEISESR